MEEVYLLLLQSGFTKGYEIRILYDPWALIRGKRIKESSLSKPVLRSLNMGHLWNPMLPPLADRPRQASEYSHQFQGHSTCVLGWVTALPFPTSIPVIALLAGIGKNPPYLAPVSSSQIEGSFSNRWHVLWVFNINCAFVFLLLEDNTCKGNKILFPRPKTDCSICLGKSPHRLNKRG